MLALPINIGIMETQLLTRKAMIQLLNQFQGFKVILEVNDGIELKDALSKARPPDLLLLELELPIKKSMQTLKWLHEQFPDLPVMVISSLDAELMLVDILKAGARAFLKKNILPEELQNAIVTVIKNGYYHTTFITRKLMRTLYNDQKEIQEKYYKLTDKEINFLELSSTDLTYKQIADKMEISTRGLIKSETAFFKTLM